MVYLKGAKRDFSYKSGSAGSNDLFSLICYGSGYCEYDVDIVLKQISNKTVDGVNEISYKIKDINFRRSQCGADARRNKTTNTQNV